MPYLQTKSEIPGRRESEVMRFSATPSSYLAATPSNVLYGALRVPNRPERRLFPGLLIVLLAIAGVARQHTPLVFVAYVVAAAVAFELSLGLHGVTYRLLYEHISFFQGFRALARIGVFVLLFVAVLGAYGYARLVAGARPLVRRAALAAAVAILVMEYRVVSVPLESYPNDAPPLHTFLASQPPGVVAEVPMPIMENWPAGDARISYLSTFHWHPMVNGYSGFMPQSYADRLAALRDFPDDRSLARLHQDAVRYLVVHLTQYRDTEIAGILDTLGRRHGLAELGRFWDGDGEAVVFALR
jgi:hypothetical protein